MKTYLEKIKQGLKILRLTNLKYFRASQMQDKVVTYNINNVSVRIEGQSVLSMLFEIVVSDVYHLKQQKHPKIIFDIGANIGVFSIHAATLFPECDVYAFEPSDKNFILLKRNTQGFSNIHCLNMAVSNYDGTAYLNGGNDPTAFKIADMPSDEVLQQCNIATLHTFMLNNSIKYIDILKLDCEGAEYEIVNSNISCVNQVVGEYHRLENRNPSEIKEALIRHGFLIKQWTNSPTQNAGIFWGLNNNIIIQS